MQCPKCNEMMEEVHAAYQDYAHRCLDCRGLFVSRSAMSSLCREWFKWPNRKTEEYIDTGSAAKGREYDVVDDIDCPACGVRMSHVSVDRQTHIWLEQCNECGGIFFDAGELTDARYRTFIDWIKDRVKGRRPGDKSARLPDLPE